MSRATAPTKAEKQRFLREDFYDALRWLFEGAVAWQAAKEKEEKGEETGRHQAVLGMYTSLVQARALYEFFYGSDRLHADDTRGCDFASSWSERAASGSLYSRYMAVQAPVNKRVFHLAYNRNIQGGDPQLNTLVLEIAKEIRELTGKFASGADHDFRECVACALRGALVEAEDAAEHYGVLNPF